MLLTHTQHCLVGTNQIVIFILLYREGFTKPNELHDVIILDCYSFIVFLFSAASVIFSSSKFFILLLVNISSSGSKVGLDND